MIVKHSRPRVLEPSESGLVRCGAARRFLFSLPRLTEYNALCYKISTNPKGFARFLQKYDVRSVNRHHVKSGPLVQDVVRVRALPNCSQGIGFHVTISSGVIMSVGGPAFIYWVSPTEEELFKARL